MLWMKTEARWWILKAPPANPRPTFIGNKN